MWVQVIFKCLASTSKWHVWCDHGLKVLPSKAPQIQEHFTMEGRFLANFNQPFGIVETCNSYLDVFPNANSQLLIFWRVTVSSSHHIPTIERFMKGLLRHHFCCYRWWGLVLVHSPFLTNTYCSAGWGWLQLNQHNCETIVSQLVVCDYILYL